MARTSQIKNKTIEIITSAFNEEDCLPELFARLLAVLKKESSYSFRILVMDNGSHDSSWRIIQDASAKDNRIFGFRMSRNFSLDAAFTCGIDQAKADAIIIMTSDLQDPPEAIPKLLRKYEEGFDQVLVKITDRGSVPFTRRVMSKLFYKIASKMTDGMLPESVSDFRLMNRKTYEAVGRMRESHRFLRGLGSWVGFKSATIELERPPRFAGESKWLGMPLSRVISHASRSILAYSATPLLFVSAMGLLLSGLSLIVVIGLAIFWLVSGVPFAGFGTIVGLIFLGFSLTMLSIGILAQYLGLVYEEVKQRPLYIISEQTKDS